MNKDNTEIILFGTNKKKLMIAIHFDTKGHKVKDTVKNLGVLHDYDLSFNNHVKSITKSASFHLENIANLMA